jgi:hypothetical protein
VRKLLFSMTQRLSISLSFLLLLLLLGTFWACGSSVPHPPYMAQPAGALVQVDFPAPPARVEFVPAQPHSGAVWVRGEWQWQGRRWGWKPGVWVIPPEGAKYAPWATTRASNGQLYYAAGTWRDADGGEVPSPPAFQRPNRRSSAAVINVEGEAEPTGQDAEHAGVGDAGASPLEPDAAPK